MTPNSEASTASEHRSSSPLDRPRARSSRTLAIVAAVTAHGVLLLGAGRFAATPGPKRAARQVQVTRMMNVRLEPPPEVAPEVEPPPPEAAPLPSKPSEPQVSRKMQRSRPPAPAPEPQAPLEPTTPPTPPPAAAPAMAALTAAPTDDAPTTPKLVAGTATSSPGGTSAASGTANQHVGAKSARADGVGESDAPHGKVDLSRPPGLAGGARWDCPFPREADYEGINRASVILAVKVDAQGKVKTVQVHNDPGFGFGREARRCALRKNWQPGLDRSGTPVARAVALRVHFKR